MGDRFSRRLLPDGLPHLVHLPVPSSVCIPLLRLCLHPQELQSRSTTPPEKLHSDKATTAATMTKPIRRTMFTSLGGEFYMSRG